MHNIDACVLAANRRMMDCMSAVFEGRGDGRLRFFRLDQKLKVFDAKHDDRTAVRSSTPGARLDYPNRRYGNEAIDFDNFFFDSFRCGGIASLDNRHSSGLGYAG